jgi:hypothetical protein
MLSVSLRMYVYFSLLLMFGTKRNLPPFFFFPYFCFNMKKEEREAGSPPFQGELTLVGYFGLTLLHTQKEASYFWVKLGDGYWRKAKIHVPKGHEFESY